MIVVSSEYEDNCEQLAVRISLGSQVGWCRWFDRNAQDVEVSLAVSTQHPVEKPCRCHCNTRRSFFKEPRQAGCLDAKMLSHKEERHGSACSEEENSCPI